MLLNENFFDKWASLFWNKKPIQNAFTVYTHHVAPVHYIHLNPPHQVNEREMPIIEKDQLNYTKQDRRTSSFSFFCRINYPYRFVRSQILRYIHPCPCKFFFSIQDDSFKIYTKNLFSTHCFFIEWCSCIYKNGRYLSCN